MKEEQRWSINTYIVLKIIFKFHFLSHYIIFFIFMSIWKILKEQSPTTNSRLPCGMNRTFISYFPRKIFWDGNDRMMFMSVWMDF